MTSEGVSELSNEQEFTTFEKIRRWLWFDPKNDPPPISNIRAYQLHSSSNYLYFCGGKFRTSKALGDFFGLKYHALPLTIIAIVFPFIIFLIFEASWFWHNVSPALIIIFCYLWCITFSSFIKGALYDPGMLPKNIHIVDDYQALPPEYQNILLSDGSANDHLHGLKYCNTCFIWRPIRSTHCSRCGVCINNMDHHCPWMGTCVGQRNYWNFIAFLISVNLCLIYLVAMVFWRINCYGLLGAHWALFLGIYSLLALPYAFLLLIFHIYIGFMGITTREFLNMEIITGNKFKDACAIPYYTPNLWHNIYHQWFRSRGWPNWRAREYVANDDLRVSEIIVGQV